MTSRAPRSVPPAYRQLVALVATALSGAAFAGIADSPGPAARGIPRPITFERNDGQFPADVMFASRGRSAPLALRAGEIAIGEGVQPLRLRLRDANPAPEVQPEKPLAARSHYYTGVEPIVDVPHYGELHVKDVYPGIDVALHGGEGSLEYDFVVSPGADPRDIRIDLRGLDEASIDAQGNLRFEHGGQVLTQHAPVAYQGEGEARHGVDAHFEIVEGAEGPEARIALGPYDGQEPLVIDPVITYSTYIGSSGSVDTAARVDAAQRIYYAYEEASGPFGETQVIECVDPVTSTLVYKTHFGGGGITSTVMAVTLGGPGSSTAYVAGRTSSATFPVAGNAGGLDAFVAVFAPTGQLKGGIKFGGSGADEATAVTIAPSGDIFIAGNTTSTDFPRTTGPALNGFGGGVAHDGFVARYTSALVPVYRRLVGGGDDDRINGIAVGASSAAVVVGQTNSADFPLVNASPPLSPPPGADGMRGFATKLSGDGASLAYSQYVGGRSLYANAVAIDPVNAEAVVVGAVDHAGLVPASAAPYGGGQDGFLLRLSPSGTPTFATYLGGSGFDDAIAVTVNALGDAYVGGATQSPDFPLVAPLSQGTTLKGTQDAFIARVRKGAIDFSSYLGGNAADNIRGVALDGDGALYVSGLTASGDFPTLPPHSPFTPLFHFNFVTRISGLPPPNAPSAFLNISTRGEVRTGDDVLIGGFVVGGTSPKTVVVAAYGPSLVGAGVANALRNPVLRLVRSSDQSTIAINDDWGSGPNAAQIQAAGLAPPHENESAIMATLPPGAYTAIVSGVADSTGVGIVAAYEVDHPEAPLINISTRGQVLTGTSVMIAGFIIEGSAARTVVVTGIGPALAGAGVPNALPNPLLTLVRSSDGAVLATNDDWGSAPNAFAIQATGFAPAHARESAIMMTLPPGAYTAILSGAAGETGVGLVAVYSLQ